MPNWVEGKLKIRGKPEDIKRWVEECLHCYTTNWLGDGAHTELVEGAVRFEHNNTKGCLRLTGPRTEQKHLRVLQMQCPNNGDRKTENER